MSALVDGKPISMWTEEELREAVDRIVSTPQYSRELLIVAELAVRAFNRATTKET